MPLHAHIDEQLCSGHGNCVVAAPEIFDLDPDTNIAAVVSAHLTDDDGPALAEAETDCPARAVLVSRK